MSQKIKPVFAQAQQPAANNQQQLGANHPQKVIEIGSGIKALKPLTGMQLMALATHPPTAQKIADDVAEFLYSLGYSANTKFDPQNYPALQKMIYQHLQNKYGQYLNLLNPEILNQ